MARAKPHEPWRVGLVGPPDISHYGRQVTRGVSRYANTVGHWVLHATNHSQVRARLSRWRPHGAIFIIPSWGLRAVRPLDCPVVNVLTPGTSVPARMASVAVDHHAVGRLAAEHFLERGFRHFAFCGNTKPRVSRLRLQGFRRRLADERPRFRVQATRVRAFQAEADPSFARSDALCLAWLRSLPKPVGVFTCDDQTALTLAIACMVGGVDVPGEVALLGAGDDDMLCNRSSPPLSSVEVPGEQIGFRAAELLDELMAGARVPRAPVLVPPQGVVTRASTDILAIEDAEVASVCRFIRENFHRRIDVSSVVQAASLSRRVLEQRFKRAVGRTLGKELTRVRIEHAKRLLADTELSMPKVAERIGLANAARLSLVFRRAMGMTPTAYRLQVRF